MGEILKEEGIIKPLPAKMKKEPRVKFEEETDLRKVVMTLERLQTEVNMLKDAKPQADEKIRELSEKIGEIRSLVFQREGTVKEMETKVKSLEDIVSDIKPERIIKEMKKREEEIGETQIRIEKVEAMNKNLLKDLKNAQKILENIKSMENLKKILRDIEDMVSKANETKSEINRSAGKAESFYTEMESRIKEFPGFKMKLEKLDELIKELTRMVDDINIRAGGFASREDIESFKKSIDDVIASNREKNENRIKEIEDALKIPSGEVASRLKKLEKRKKSISNLLKSLEDQYRKASIKEKTYNEIKEKNETLFKQTNEEIKKLEGEKGFTIKSLPFIVDELKEGIKTIEKRTDILERSLKEQKGHLEPILETIKDIKKVKPVTGLKELTTRIETMESKIEDFRKMEEDLKAQKGVDVIGTIRVQTGMIEDILKKLKEMSDKMINVELKTKFFEILDMLVRIKDAKEVSSYISQLEDTISKMKANNLWDKGNQYLAKDLLADIADNWHKYGYHDTAKIFEDEIEKIGMSETHESMLTY